MILGDRDNGGYADKGLKNMTSVVDTEGDIFTELNGSVFAWGNVNAGGQQFATVSSIMWGASHFGGVVATVS